MTKTFAFALACVLALASSGQSVCAALVFGGLWLVLALRAGAVCRAVAPPVLLLEDADDVRYQWMSRIEKRLGRALRVARPVKADERADTIRQYFDSPPVRRTVS